jgi:membrane-bound inhibitor of C-type lysozyme
LSAPARRSGPARLAALAAALVVAGAAQASEIITARYTCERNVVVPAVYINTDTENYAVITVEGKQVAMRQAPSASGARYIALDEQDSYRWFTKGNTALLLWLAADHTAQEQMLLSECRTD